MTMLMTAADKPACVSPAQSCSQTLKDIAAKRSWMINKQHLAQLSELGLVEMQEDVPHLTVAGQNTT